MKIISYTSILKKKQPTVFDVECMCPFTRLMHITLAYNIKYAMTDCFINLLSEKSHQSSELCKDICSF